MMRVRQSVGKLAEVRFARPIVVDDLGPFMAEIRKLVEASAEPLVFCCDWRDVDPFETSVADTIVWIMRRDNPRIGGNGVLAADPKVFAGVQRILREAGNPRRQVFKDIPSLVAWLDPQLTPEERARRDAFLAERA